MGTTDTEKVYEVYAVGEFISAINRMMKEPTPIKITTVSAESGDVAFACTLSDMGITRQAFLHPFYRSHLFANMLGELLVRQNIDKFCDRVMDKNYGAHVKQYNHTGMGLRLENDDVLNFYGIKDKAVHINVNMFNYDIEIKDLDKTISS